jgi:hypothetical protein
MLLGDPPVTSRESWDVTMIELFRAGILLSQEGFFPDQEKKIPENPEIPEVFPVRKSLIIDIHAGFPAGDGDHSLTFQL